MAMKTRFAFPFLILAMAVAAAAAADDKKEPPKGTDDKKEAPKANTADAKLDHFKQLAGDWVGKGNGEGKDIEARINYKVTSGGSAVVETIGPGTEHEMVTVITKDGDSLALTHYCMLGNQPHMKAEGKGDDNKVAFNFTGAGNMKSDKDMHMHSVTFTFVDKDTLKAEWTSFADGKESAKMVFDLKRKK
jgi:hypothetical protein